MSEPNSKSITIAVGTDGEFTEVPNWQEQFKENMSETITSVKNMSRAELEAEVVKLRILNKKLGYSNANLSSLKNALVAILSDDFETIRDDD